MNRFDELKARHRNERDSYPQNLSLRIHRALSWLNAAEQSDDLDTQFIFLWISFNSAYARMLDDPALHSEQSEFNEFINRLVYFDERSSKLADLVWNRYSTSIRLLMDNHYVYNKFWDHVRGVISEEDWEKSFQCSKLAAKKALQTKDTAKVITLTLSRIYVLRNQILHGGATWQGSVNRQQMIDGRNLMAHLVPIMIEIMMDNSAAEWGVPTFPVID